VHSHLQKISFSQDNADCITAMNVCSKDNLIVNQSAQLGSFIEIIIDECEFPFFEPDTELSIWYRYEFSDSGTFTFLINPNDYESDIDFVVFESDQNNCENLSSIRCMFSGVSLVQPNNNACLGATGLSITSTDTMEAPGCQEGDDNLLAPLQVESGDVVYLMIIDFSQTNTHDYTIEHGGSAELICNSVSTEKIGIQNEIDISPNPFVSNIKITSPAFGTTEGKIQVIDLNGEYVYSAKLKATSEVNLSHLESGIYILKYIGNDNKVHVSKLIKH